MNTTAKGDKFEEICYNVINSAINKGELGSIPSQCKVYKKKGYYSDKRKSDIVFDLSIEVWFPNAERYTFLYLIECKNYGSSIPVNDVEEFWGKVQQVSGMNIKGIFMANNKLQKGAFEFAESVRFMLIQVDVDDSYNIKLYNSSREAKNQNDDNDFSFIFESQYKKLFIKNNGIKRLSSEQIEIIAAEKIDEFDRNLIPWAGVNLHEYKLHLENKYGITVCFETRLSDVQKKDKILGLFDSSNNAIYVDKTIINTSNFPFVFAHEIGHFFLHRNIKMEQEIYDSFNDSEYSFRLDKHELKNDKNWIEWQANKFAAAFLIPLPTLVNKLERFQKQVSVRNMGTIYVDNQYKNQQIARDTINHLALALGVSKKSIEYRLLEQGILKYTTNPKHISSYLEEWLN